MRHQINRLGEKVFCGLIFLPQEVKYLLVSVLNAGHIYLKIIILETHRDFGLVVWLTPCNYSGTEVQMGSTDTDELRNESLYQYNFRLF